MSLATSYGILILAVVLGVTSNSFAKSAEGFTLLFPSIITGITIVATIVIPVMILGKSRVKPSALLAKLFEVTPRTTAKISMPYDVARLI